MQNQWTHCLHGLNTSMTGFESSCFSPDIQRDRHHGVENDDVGPEGKEGREQEVVHRWVPRQVDLKQGPHFSLPHRITHSEDHTHAHQEAKDLKETHKKKSRCSRCPEIIMIPESERCECPTQRTRVFIRRSMLVRLNLVRPLFCISFVSGPWGREKDGFDHLHTFDTRTTNAHLQR